MASHPSLAYVAGTPRRVVRKAGHTGRAFTESKPIQFLARFGYVVRGIVYLVPGLLALELALGRRGAMLALTDAIVVIGRQPFGRALLWVVLAGLIGYAVWGLTRALLDPWGRGDSPRGIGRRFGYAMSACAYASFGALTVNLLIGGFSHGGPEEWAARLLAHPLANWLLGMIGLGWIVCAGFSEVALGWTSEFVRDLRWERMGPGEHRWAVRMGRIGIVMRGLIFAGIGCLIVAAAFHVAPGRAGDMGEALQAIGRQPFGRVFLAAAACGLIVFGSFSILCARWMRTRAGGASRRANTGFHSREVHHGRF